MASSDRRAARTLRVLVAAPIDERREYAWALFDGDGRRVETGRSAPAAWPAAAGREAVVGADAVRMVALALPPLPRARLHAAATFALEERLASAPEDALVAIREANERGGVIAIVTARELGRSLIDAGFSRAVGEPELAQRVEGWRWCEGEDGGFVRTQDGAAFSVGAAPAPSLPPELTMALAHATREQRAPAAVVVDAAADPASLQRWTTETGIRFVAGTPWQWHAQSLDAYRLATDILSAVDERSSRPAAKSPPMLAVAATIVVFAMVLHALAGLGTWIWQRMELSRAERELVTIARQAGAENVDGANAAATLATLHAGARHRAGRDAPIDAMPVFARAAPALAALPAGTLRTATWSGGAWTLELGTLDDNALEHLVVRTRSAGLAPLHARTANGVRLRLSPAP